MEKKLEELIDKALSGDKVAFTKLIDSVYLYLYKTAKSRLHNEDDVDDAIQETLLKAYLNLDKLKNKSNFTSWIIQILINECNNIYRKYSKNVHLFNKAVDNFNLYKISNNSNNLDNDIYFEELLNKLNEDEKEIAYLHFKENYTAEKIAKLLNSNKNTIKSKLFRIRAKLKRLAIIILTIFIITATTVLAKEFIEFIKSLFTTSTSAIDSAVENGYVQNIDMDFVYDNNIGIKVDSLVMDDTHLDVSYMFDCSNYGEVENIKLADYSIIDENNNNIFISKDNSITDNFDNIILSVRDYIIPHKSENTLKYSLLYTTLYDKTNNFKKLTFHINNVALTSNNENRILYGNWDFELILDDIFYNKNIENYKATYDNNYIKEFSTSITETSLKIYIKFNTKINDNILYDYNSITLDNYEQRYNLINGNFYNDCIDLIFDIGKYTKDTEKLRLSIKINNEEYIYIYLIKDYF